MGLLEGEVVLENSLSLGFNLNQSAECTVDFKNWHHQSNEMDWLEVLGRTPSDLQHPDIGFDYCTLVHIIHIKTSKLFSKWRRRQQYFTKRNYLII